MNQINNISDCMEPWYYEDNFNFDEDTHITDDEEYNY